MCTPDTVWKQMQSEYIIFLSFFPLGKDLVQSSMGRLQSFMGHMGTIWKFRELQRYGWWVCSLTRQQVSRKGMYLINISWQTEIISKRKEENVESNINRIFLNSKLIYLKWWYRFTHFVLFPCYFRARVPTANRIIMTPVVTVVVISPSRVPNQRSQTSIMWTRMGLKPIHWKINFGVI